MGFGLGALVSGLGSALGIGQDVVSNWATNSARESLNKNIGQTNIKLQKQYDRWTIEQDKAYEKWWQDLLYDLQSNQYYNLAKKYAQNTASWAVEGLKKAGLNPILAGIDSNLSSSMGNAQPSGSGRHTKGSIPSSSAPSASIGSKVDVAGAMQASSASKQAEEQANLTKTQSEIADATRDAQIQSALTSTDRQSVDLSNARLTGAQITAHTAKTNAEADLVQAQAAKTAVDAANSAKNAGLGGVYGAAARLSSEIAGKDEVNKRLEQFAMRPFGFTGDMSHSGKFGENGPVIHVKGVGNQTQPWYHDRVDKFRYDHGVYDSPEPKVRHVRPLPPPGKKRK